MYEITTNITVNDTTEQEVCVLPIDTQEELIDFLDNGYCSMELDRLYGLLNELNGRTMALIEPSSRRALTRRITGVSRSYDRKPIEGCITITARRVA